MRFGLEVIDSSFRNAFLWAKHSQTHTFGHSAKHDSNDSRAAKIRAANDNFRRILMKKS